MGTVGYSLMASLYKREGKGISSPYWWVKYTDPLTGKRRQESTGILHGSGGALRKAREIEAQKTLLERQARAASRKGDQWSDWVDDFIAARYRQSPGSKTRYTAAWRTLSMFLDELEIARPAQLTRAHCFAYVEWRHNADPKEGKYRATQNTIILEIKFLGLLMKEAVIRGYAPANPARELGFKRAKRRLFPEYSDAEYELIEKGIAITPKPMQTVLNNSFLIGRYHGVRLVETHLNPCTNVRLWQEADGTPRGSIRFFQKGGKDRTKPLHPKLIPLFAQLQADKAKETFPMPKSFAKEWHNFLHRCGIKAASPNACFHSLRVTVKSRLRRAGIGKELAMEYLSHEAADVDESYNRFTLDDLRECHRADL